MSRYIVRQFDESTFIVIDQIEQREICVCSDYGDREDAEERAGNIAKLLNSSV